MIKYLLLLAVLISGNSTKAQIPSDTICIEVPKYKKIYTAALQKKLVDSLLFISNAQLSELKTKVSLLEEKEVEQRNFYNGQIINLQGQVSIYKEQITGYEAISKRLTRQLKFQKIITKGSIVVVAGLLVKMFLIKK